jgi:hypothetical protein
VRHRRLGPDSAPPTAIATRARVPAEPAPAGDAAGETDATPAGADD